MAVPKKIAALVCSYLLRNFLPKSGYFLRGPARPRQNPGGFLQVSLCAFKKERMWRTAKGIRSLGSLFSGIQHENRPDGYGSEQSAEIGRASCRERVYIAGGE